MLSTENAPRSQLPSQIKFVGLETIFAQKFPRSLVFPLWVTAAQGTFTGQGLPTTARAPKTVCGYLDDALVLFSCKPS